jgi:hypothetical protein
MLLKQMVDTGKDVVRIDGFHVPPLAEAITGTKQSFAPARYYHLATLFTYPPEAERIIGTKLRFVPASSQLPLRFFH